ncbi:uncharacterized protein MONOS_2458 [Monocercomonoides exilis]|uniref:uncharacterized protein n=1 Tax=Monocercomonoides exilis TaxID=2049356 RepID=UPI0035599B53|nr:hypothetical protein MONOS_2458 [Monocercomonoides exilis]|eukprot:MONOS_2458.1-p1 / transcript=MONOS_2458.1 / gene=MONOS_2458 / organism=Monocercomonoides_exilis_PA203 / gene_product=unspecified product / transcript_product=unspecified product / location=Mono_scaffold00051:39999-42064(-) / protein_length=642 / sequence_SO=supercontig / SO=protein_coding / is_pseudo=false
MEQIYSTQEKEREQAKNESTRVQDLVREYELLVRRADELERGLLRQNEQIEALRGLEPMGRLSYRLSELILATSVVRLNEQAVIGLRAVSEAQTLIPLASHLRKSAFRIHVTCFQVDETGTQIVHQHAVGFRVLDRNEAANRGIDMTRSELADSHFVVVFTMDTTGTYKVSVYKPSRRERRSVWGADGSGPTTPVSLGESPLIGWGLSGGRGIGAGAGVGSMVGAGSFGSNMSAAPVLRGPGDDGRGTPDSQLSGSSSIESPLLGHLGGDGIPFVPGAMSTSYGTGGAAPGKVTSPSVFLPGSPTPASSSASNPALASSFSLLSGAAGTVTMPTTPPQPPQPGSAASVMPVLPSSAGVFGRGEVSPLLGDQVSRTPSPYGSGSVSSEKRDENGGTSAGGSTHGSVHEHLHVHVKGSPMYLRNGFSFREDEVSKGLRIVNAGMGVEYCSPGVGFQQGKCNFAMKGGRFMWRFIIDEWNGWSPLVVGVVDDKVWMPGLSLTQTVGAVVVDVLDLRVYVNGEESRVFRRTEKYALGKGSTIDVYLDCLRERVLLSLDGAPAREVRDISPFPESLTACVQLYAEKTGVSVGFPFPKTIIDKEDDDEEDDDDEEEMEDEEEDNELGISGGGKDVFARPKQVFNSGF